DFTKHPSTASKAPRFLSLPPKVPASKVPASKAPGEAPKPKDVAHKDKKLKISTSTPAFTPPSRTKKVSESFAPNPSKTISVSDLTGRSNDTRRPESGKSIY